MIDPPTHVGELHFALFPYYALTNWVAAIRAWQLHEINLLIRLWMVIGLVAGAFGHFKDMTQVWKGDPRLHFDVVKVTKSEHLFGMFMFGFPSLLGIYAMAYLYISNVSGYSMESYIIAVLICFTLCYDLYFTMGWGLSFFWHKNHVLAHCVFLLSEYTATGYFAHLGYASNSFFGVQLIVAILLEFVLFNPEWFFKISAKKSESNISNGIWLSLIIFGTAFGLDYAAKCRDPFAYIPGALKIRHL